MLAKASFGATETTPVTLSKDQFVVVDNGDPIPEGSGTRILTDYLCQKEGVDPDQVYGYEREEVTHNAVAVQIAGGSADAGMGIYSAAKLYGLDFLPICVEEYDLLIPEKVWNTGLVKQLIRTLGSREFRERIEAMGGYTLDRPGEIIEWKKED